MDLFDRTVVLFEEEGLEEGMVVECAMDEDGGLMVMQESYGPLTGFSFGESPHRVELFAGPDSARALVEHFSLEDAWQLPFALRFECAGCGSYLKVQELLDCLEAAYDVRECPTDD